MNKRRLLKIRSIIEQAASKLDDDVAVVAPELFPQWKSECHYTQGTRVQYNGILYKVLQDHDSQENWLPDNAPSLFARVLTDDNKILDWVQPDSTNAYMIGDKVYHNGSTWESTIDNNVWEPGVYGWVQI